MNDRSEFKLTSESLPGERLKLNSSFSLAPLIPAKPNGKPVTFYGLTGTYGAQKKLRIRVGAVAKNRTNDEGDGLCPALHIELWHLILVLLSFWRERPDLAVSTVNPSFGAVWRRFTCSNARPSPNQLEGVARLLDELDALRMGVCVDGGEEKIADVVKYGTRRVKLNFGTTTENVFDGFTFDPNFISCLLYAQRFQDVRLDVLAQVTSRYVRAAYLWLPARASHHPHPRPAIDQASSEPEYLGEMAILSSEEFCRNLGLPKMPRSKRQELLLQGGKKSVLSQLHGLQLIRQHLRLGVCWWSSEADLFIGTYAYHAEDWMPGASVADWPDRGNAKPARGDLYANFIDGGGDAEAYWHYLNSWRRTELDPFFVERMVALGVKQIDKYSVLYRQMIAILGPDIFRDALGNLGEGAAKKPDTGFLLRGILFERVKTVALKRTKQYHQLMQPKSDDHGTSTVG